VAFRELLITIGGTIDEFRRTAFSDLQFLELRTAILTFLVLMAVAGLVLVVRSTGVVRSRRAQVALPALVPGMRRSPAALVRHAPLILFLVGLPFFAIALADPRTGFSREEVSYPGRRIAIAVDGSGSMVLPFQSAKLGAHDTPAFFTAIASAEHFIKQRMDGPYHDLVALIQFGNQAYVVTPFTTDYENVLLSTRLVSDPREWGQFNDFGTTILEGIDKGLELFQTFDFLNASGNLMIVFTDGRDGELTKAGRSLEAIVAQSRRYRIPVYMIRTAFNKRYGQVDEDSIWRPIIERTGGRFYAASNEDDILKATAEIDRLSPGRIDTRHYSVQRPRYAGFLLIAVVFWLFAAFLKLGFSTFRTFP
jgi:Ca-activated chloride channel family protein